MEENPPEPGDRFVTALTESQSHLLGYIMASVGNVDDSRDILQQTNLTLWRNFSRFDPSRPFLPWAISLARFQILGFYRDRHRDRLVFDSDVLDLLMARAEESIEQIPRRQTALGECLTRLNDDHRTLLALYYAHRKSIAQIATISGRSEDGVKSLFVRVRKILRDCIDSKLQPSTSPES